MFQSELVLLFTPSYVVIKQSEPLVGELLLFNVCARGTFVVKKKILIKTR